MLKKNVFVFVFPLMEHKHGVIVKQAMLAKARGICVIVPSSSEIGDVIAGFIEVLFSSIWESSVLRTNIP